MSPTTLDAPWSLDPTPFAAAMQDDTRDSALADADFAPLDLGATHLTLADASAAAPSQTPNQAPAAVASLGFDSSFATATTEPATQPTTEPAGRKKMAVFVTIYIENDASAVRYFGGTDRHYTNGIKLSLACQPDWAADFGRWMPLGCDFMGPDSGFAAGWVAGQNMFTPADKTLVTPDPHDEPYAGFLYGGMFMQRANKHVMDHLEFDVGTVGHSAHADDAQIWVHHFAHAGRPMGWDHQLDDEIAFDLTARRKRRFDLPGSGKAFGWQLIPQLGGTVGTVHRQLEGAVTGRVGFNLPDDFGTGRINDVAAFTGNPAQWHKFGCYIYGRIGGRAVEHNLFLDGSTFRPSPHVDSLPFVGDAEFGFAVQMFKHMELAWSQNHMTREFHGQHGTDGYGSITLTFFGTF